LLALLGDTADGDAPFVHAVLQYSEGGSLKRYLQAPTTKGARDDAAREGMAPPTVAVGTRQLALALAHLHSLGICHRDVKPANILLSTAVGVGPTTLHLRLCDFGFACVCGTGQERLTREFCTPQYAAPEIASPADAHRGYLGRPVDMWALGCVVYEMLHRRPAFKAEERFELEGLIRNGRFQPFSQHIRVPPDAKALIRALLVPVDARPTAERLLREFPWISPEAAAVRAAEREQEKERMVAEEEAVRLRQGRGAFGL
jgi:serine/threonine protein kinase